MNTTRMLASLDFITAVDIYDLFHISFLLIIIIIIIIIITIIILTMCNEGAQSWFSVEPPKEVCIAKKPGFH